MVNYGASIQLADNMTPILDNIITALNMTVSTVYDMQASVDGFDASGLNVITETIAQAELARDSLVEKLKEPVNIPEPQPITWTSNNFDVFTDTGIERFESEVQSALDMVNRLTAAQRSISQTAANTSVFSKDAVLDMIDIGNKMTFIQNRMQQIESNPANPLDPNASNELERLRQQFSQALDYQEQMKAAVKDLDVSRANQLYQQLNNIIDRTEREIRDNVNAQGQFNSSINQSITSANTLNGTFSKIASGLGLYKISAVLKQTATGAVNYASDLQEVQNVVDVTFSSASAAVDEWASNTLHAYGINELSAKQYAGTMGAMLKSSGVSADAVSEMSMSIAELSGDMASFYNLDNDEAFNKIRSGISGETEPLKQLGINMSVANLEAYALSQGIEATYSEMSQAEQVTLRYNYLLSATADAQGDFARTSDSYANQTKLLSENWSNFTSVLAADALPVLTTITQTLNDAIVFLTEHSDTVSAVLFGLATGITVAAVAWGIYTVAQWIATGAAKTFFTTLLTNPFVWIAIVIAVVVAWIYKWVQSLGGLKSTWEIVKLALLVGINGLHYGFYYCIDGILTMVETFRLAWKTTGTDVAMAVGDMKVEVLTMLQNMVNGSIDIINSFIATLNSIPGVSIDTIAQVTFATTAAVENNAKKQAYTDELTAYENEIKTSQAERDEKLSLLKNNLDESVITLTEAYANAKELVQVEDKAGNENNLGGIETGLGSIGGDTSDIKDSISTSSDDELEWLRKIAEREAVNKFTTAEIKLDFQSNATINSDIDIDGFINTFTEELGEVLVTTAEGLEE